MSILTDIRKEYKERFFQTPLWYLTDLEWAWLKESSIKTLKKFLTNPKTPFGIGKLLELSLYSQTTCIYGTQINGKEINVQQYVHNDITIVEEYSDRLIFKLRGSEDPSPKQLEKHVISFFNVMVLIWGTQKVAEHMQIPEGELLSVTSNITFEDGLMVESMTN